MRSVYTIGHSNRSPEAFRTLLAGPSVTGVADVRRFPSSRRLPHFEGPALARELAARGIEYRHFPALGGFRLRRADSRHVAWKNDAFRGYADYMETDEFEESLRALEAWAHQATVAVMCAEADARHCHRQLIADALVRDGFAVRHIVEAGRIDTHTLTPGVRLQSGRLIYDAGAALGLPGL
jgi:uncharacterized protein (DUF488 family)